jgi:hypothetical protein
MLLADSNIRLQTRETIQTNMMINQTRRSHIPTGAKKIIEAKPNGEENPRGQTR